MELSEYKLKNSARSDCVLARGCDMHAVAVVASVKVRICQRLPILKTFQKRLVAQADFHVPIVLVNVSQVGRAPNRVDFRWKQTLLYPGREVDTCTSAKLTVIKLAASRLTNVTTTQ